MQHSFRSLDGTTTTLEDDVVEGLDAGLRGNLVLPGAETYDAARQIWNAMIDRKPGLIIECRGAADVQEAVQFVSDHGLLFSIRGAGHNIAGKALADGGVLIDLSHMRSVHVDPHARRARAEPGVTLGDLDRETQAFGLAVPTGINSTTGIAGLTLGGGFGWLSRTHGLTIDSLISVDLVTAGGEFLQASANEHPDLFWALRGGGGNFGVVTSFEYACHPVGPEVFCGLVVHPFENARELLGEYRALCAAAPDALSVWTVLRHAPPLPFLPEAWHGKMVLVFAMLYTGDVDEGEVAAAPFRALGSPVGEHVGAMPFMAFQSAFDPLLTPGLRNYWKSHNFNELTDVALDTVVAYADDLPSGESEIFLAQMGGATGRIASDATAYLHRDAQFILNVHTRWQDPADDRRCVDWARAFFDASAPHATGGVYINFMSEDEVERVQATHGANYARLQRVKAAYDPGNLFRVNQNIAPAGAHR